MKKIQHFRIILDFVLLVCIFSTPFWVSLILSILLFIFVENFVEGIIFAFIFDVFYGASYSHFLNFGIVTLSAMFLYIASKIVRKNLLRN